jgi:hypothetical protein
MPDPRPPAGDAEALERRYRRLLACYPREYRQAHEEEMLGVLLAGSGSRRRPGAGESADLLLGALRIRVRRAVRSFPDSTAADALAVVSLLVPALLLAGAAPGLHEIAWWLRYESPSFSFLFTFPDAPAWAAWLVAGVLGLVGWRRTAAATACLAAAALTVLLTVDVGNSLYPSMYAAPWVLLGLLGAVAATVSPGARHSLASLGGVRYAAVLTASGLVVGSHLLGHHYLAAHTAALWLLPAVVVLACRPATRTGRRVLVLLALPGTAYLITLAEVVDGWMTGYGLPVAVACGLGCLLWTAGRRRWPRGSAARGGSLG